MSFRRPTCKATAFWLSEQPTAEILCLLWKDTTDSDTREAFSGFDLHLSSCTAALSEATCLEQMEKQCRKFTQYRLDTDFFLYDDDEDDNEDNEDIKEQAHKLFPFNLFHTWWGTSEYAFVLELLVCTVQELQLYLRYWREDVMFFQRRLLFGNIRRLVLRALDRMTEQDLARSGILPIVFQKLDIVFQVLVPLDTDLALLRITRIMDRTFHLPVLEFFMHLPCVGGSLVRHLPRQGWTFTPTLKLIHSAFGLPVEYRLNSLAYTGMLVEAGCGQMKRLEYLRHYDPDFSKTIMSLNLNTIFADENVSHMFVRCCTVDEELSLILGRGLSIVLTEVEIAVLLCCYWTSTIQTIVLYAWMLKSDGKSLRYAEDLVEDVVKCPISLLALQPLGLSAGCVNRLLCPFGRISNRASLHKASVWTHHQTDSLCELFGVFVDLPGLIAPGVVEVCFADVKEKWFPMCRDLDPEWFADFELTEWTKDHPVLYLLREPSTTMVGFFLHATMALYRHPRNVSEIAIFKASFAYLLEKTSRTSTINLLWMPYLIQWYENNGNLIDIHEGEEEAKNSVEATDFSLSFQHPEKMIGFLLDSHSSCMKDVLVLVGSSWEDDIRNAIYFLQVADCLDELGNLQLVLLLAEEMVVQRVVQTLQCANNDDDDGGDEEATHGCEDRFVISVLDLIVRREIEVLLHDETMVARAERQQQQQL